VTANLGVTRRRSLCRHVLLTAVWLNTTLGGSPPHVPSFLVSLTWKNVVDDNCVDPPRHY